MSSASLLNGLQNDFLGEGSYGCVYYPGIRCNGKPNKKKLITKIQEINFYSDNEKAIGNYIKTNIKNYKKYFSPIVKYCVVKFNTIEKSNLDIKKCNIIFDEYNAINEYHAANEYHTANVNNSMMTRQYFLMYSYYIQSYTLKDFYIENDFEFTFNMLNHIYKTTYAVNLLNQNNIIHNDLHMGNILIHMKNLSPIIIDFGLSFNINNCYKLNKNYIDFQYVKKFVFDFRTDSYHFNIEKRFISFLIYNKSDHFTNEVYDNNDNNIISKEAIHFFVNDAYTSIINNEEINRFFKTSEMIDYKKALVQFYNQFLDKSKYPKYNTIVKYLLDFVYAYNDLYSVTIDLLFLYHLKDNNINEDMDQDNPPNIMQHLLTSEEAIILDFFIQLYKKVLYPDPYMRLKIAELLDTYTFIINYIKNYTLKDTNTIRLDFITSFIKFLKSKNISIEIIFYKKFAFLNFNLLCSHAIFHTIQKASIKL